ncbi:hypothetical protein AAE478_000803 [Parahypoxylon ruwenzoriense]
MPSATPFEPPMLSLGKKRKRDDGPEAQVQLITQYYQDESQNLLSAINDERLMFPSTACGYPASLLNMPRKVIPLPVSKRFRLLDENEEHLHHPHSHPLPQPCQYSQQQQQQQQQSHFSHSHPEYSTPPTSPNHSRSSMATKAHPSARLSPCHICHRKPTKKSDLDSFADCMGCEQRACFICIRACQGWLPPPSTSPISEEIVEEDVSASFTMRDVDDDNSEDGREPSKAQEPSRKEGKGGGWRGHGHREMVCSRCCVERGPEGDIVCLGCLAGMAGA